MKNLGMALKRTSVQLSETDMKLAKSLYPKLERSEFIRLCIRFVLDNQPEFIESSSARFKPLEY